MENAEEIKNEDHVKLAVIEEQKSPQGDARKRHIIQRAVELGCAEHIPDDWGIA